LTACHTIAIIISALLIEISEATTRRCAVREEGAHMNDRQAVLVKIRQHFAPVLSDKFSEYAFILEPERVENHAKIAKITYISQFVDVFGDLVEQDDYRSSSFRKRAKEWGFSISDDVFDAWIRAGCLLWD